MRSLLFVTVLSLSALLQACATVSLPLAIPPNTDGEAAKHNAEGIEHYNMNHWEVAKGHFEAAIKANPQLAEPHYNLALTLVKLDAHEDATTHFKKAAELAPNNAAIIDSSAYRRHMDVRRGSRSGFETGPGGGGMLGY